MTRSRILVVLLLIITSLTTAAPASGAALQVDLAPGVEVRESVEQLSVTGLAPGASVEVLRRGEDPDGEGEVVAEATADDFGSVLFRKLEPGDDYGIRAEGATQWDLVVDSVESSLPDQSLYENQELDEGFGYIETRDGTTLSAYVVLPGPPEDGPYPTVVEYSGYDPSNPLAGLSSLAPGIDPTPLCEAGLPTLCKAPAEPSSILAGVLGYAVVGVNVRGTGCSGGAYDFFETMQVLDGYDVIETVAAQDWVKGNQVGMVGLSYPGLSQLFVAQSQPPSLAAITPLSVYGDSGTGVLRPGGLLNTGFAISWVDQVLANAEPEGTEWVRSMIDDGDTVCEQNQQLRLQNEEVIQKAFDNPFYTEEVAAPLDIRRFADQIDVPVFLASAWQDEQTGPSFADLLDDFDSAPVTRFTLYNGLHADGFAPQVLSEWNAFLDLYVANEIPSIPAPVPPVASVFTGAVFGGPVPLPESRWTDVASAEEARAKFEAEPPIRVIFDSGAGAAPGLPVGAFEYEAEEWPVADVQAHRWWLDSSGALTDAAPTDHSAVEIQPDPAVTDTTYWSGGSSSIWQATPDYEWTPAPDGRRATFQTEPLDEPVTMLGTGSVDLWVRSSAPDPALEVLISEVRPDGQEMLVQSGRLKASYRAIEPESTELHPVQIGREEDVSTLPDGEWTEMRVLIPAFGHVFRPDSRIRITINTPGGDQAIWSYGELEVDPATENLIGTGGPAPSSVALPVLSDAPEPTPRPDCPSLRGQPCREAPPIANVVVDTTPDLSFPPGPTPSTPPETPETPETPEIPDGPQVCDGGDPVHFGDVADGNVHLDAIGCLASLNLLDGVTSEQFAPAEPMTRDQLASVLARAIEAAGVDLPEGDDAFPDSDPAHRRSINQLADAGLLLGRTDGTFGSGESVTRAQVASLVVRVVEFLTDGTLPAGSDEVPDDDGTVHEANIDKAAAAGLVEGYADGTFDPGDDIRRDQVASMISRLLDHLVADGLTLQPLDG